MTWQLDFFQPQNIFFIFAIMDMTLKLQDMIFSLSDFILG